MTQQEQTRHIGLKILGRPDPNIDPAQFDEPWATLYHRVQPISEHEEVATEVRRITADLPDRDRLFTSILAFLPNDQPAFQPLSALRGALPPLGWLWPGWIPLGHITLLGGAPGSGKSLLALDIARRALAGQPFPKQVPDRTPALSGMEPVVYLDAENTPQVLLDRAQAWDLDMDRLYPLLPPPGHASYDLHDRYQRASLERIVEEVAPILLIVDSLSSIHLRGESSYENMRVILGFLSNLAHRHQIALLLVHHLRKSDRASKGLASLADLRGSSHIAARAASVLTLSVLPASRALPSEPALLSGGQPDSTRRLEVVKTNLAQHPPPLGLLIESGPGDIPVLRYVDAPRLEPRPATLAQECAAWLLDYLASSPKPVRPNEVVNAARDAGFGRSLLYRARRSLSDLVVETGTGPNDPTKLWALNEPRT